MSVARISGPQLLDAPLRSAQEPVDVEAVGVRADLGRDPGRQPDERLGQGAIHPEGPLERREADLHLLPAHRAPSRLDRKSTRLNSSHANISYAVFCLKKKN